MREHDAAQIKTVYEHFLKAWECGDEVLMESCLKDTPFAYVSMYGHCYDKEQIKKWFKKAGPDGSAFKLLPLQSTISVAGKQAQQYAAVMGLIEKDGKHLAFGGTFCNHYEMTEKGWVMETIRFQLQSDDGMKEETLSEEGIVTYVPGDGDRALLENWHGVDERVGAFQDKIANSGNTVVTPEIDAPWRAISCRENELTDEDGMMDVLCQTSAAYDFLAMMLAVPAFAENAQVDIGGLYGVMNKRDALMYVKEKRKAMPRCFTGLQMSQAQVNNDTATAQVKVLTPECFCKDTDDYVKDVYQVEFVRQDGRWLISKLMKQ